MVDPGPMPEGPTKLPNVTGGQEPRPVAPVAASEKPVETVETVAEATVNRIAHVAAANATLQEERSRVQSLITNLVSNVANGKGKVETGAAEPAAPPTNTSASSKASNASETKEASSSGGASTPSPGIPLNDHRAYSVRGGPMSWSQNADSVTVTIAVPNWVRKEHVVVKFSTGALAVRVGFTGAGGDAHFELTQPLFAAIDTDCAMWMLDGAGNARKLVLELDKARRMWWSRLFMADDPADYAPVVEDSPGSPLSPESQTRSSPPPPPPPASSACVPEDADNETPPPDGPPPEVDATVDGDRPAEDDANAENASETDFVREVVDEIVDNVVEATEQPSPPPGRAFPVRRQQQKVMTSADIERLAEQYKETVLISGPGAAHAALQLGMFYHHGILKIPQNDAMSAYYYKYALENGALDAEAAFRLGLMYNQGAEGLEVDPEQAVRWWRVAATLGNAVSMFNLGVMAMNGNGCDMDPVEAVNWFRKAQALNPQLTPPQISKAQLVDRMRIAERVRKERAKANMSPEEKALRRDAAMEDIRKVGYATVGLATVATVAIAFRHWWRNRL